jgi:hypothetical protein
MEKGRPQPGLEVGRQRVVQTCKRQERKQPLSGPTQTSREITEHKEMGIDGTSKTGRTYEEWKEGKGEEYRERKVKGRKLNRIWTE